MIPLLKTFALTGGEWVIYILILCSVIAVAVMIERGVLLFKEKKQLKTVKAIFVKIAAEDATGLPVASGAVLARGTWPEATPRASGDPKGRPLTEDEKFESGAGGLSQISGFSARVLSAGLSHRSQGVQAAEEYALSVTFQEKQRLEERMIILSTLGNNAIYIGLFGTVLGVIKAFHDLAEQSGAGPEVVMQGLSEALIATAVGLMVALPCVIANNYFQKQIKDLFSETETMLRLLLAQLKSEKR